MCPNFALCEQFTENFEAREPKARAGHWVSAMGSSFHIIGNFIESACDTYEQL
jgi:hypothetical protein